MTVSEQEPCQVCGSEVHVVATLVPAGGDDGAEAPNPVGRCTNSSCPSNDRNDVSQGGRPTP